MTQEIPALYDGLTTASVETPFLALDLIRMDRNIARLVRRMRELGVTLRPHVKTGKSVDIARRMFETGTGQITVSTLREAEAFADAGFSDILYAVGIAPQKLDRVAALRRRGVDLCVILDSREQAAAVAATSRQLGDRLPALIEIDCDGHRGGLLPDDPTVLEVARILDRGAELRGVLVHAGESYYCRTAEALAAAAENERVVAVAAAELLRSAGFACPIVSVGSTPTAHFARNLDGVTEVRAGVFVFFDLVMMGIGVCTLDDIAISVVAAVIGHRPEKGWILTDAGWTAMSRDRGTSNQAVDQGYGLVASTAGAGELYDDLIMMDASQEHGTLAIRPGSGATLPELPIGTRVRIFPNHACATSEQHDHYVVTQGGSDVVTAVWPRIRGW